MKHLMKLKQTFKARFHVPVPKKIFFFGLRFFSCTVCMYVYRISIESVVSKKRLRNSSILFIKILFVCLNVCLSYIKGFY